VVVEVVVRCVGKIARGTGFGLQNQKPACMGSILVQGAQMQS
jgi:hypothetical protein